MHGDVEPARRSAGDGGGSEAADRESDRRRRQGEHERVEDRVPRWNEQRRGLLAERAIEREPDPPWCVERPHHECSKRRAEQERTRAEDGRERDAFAPHRSPRRAAFRRERRDQPGPCLEPRRHRDDQGDGDELEKCERSCRAEVEGAGGLVVDRCLEREARGPTEDDDDAERREAEEEGERPRSCEGRTEGRQRQLAEPPGR